MSDIDLNPKPTEWDDFQALDRVSVLVSAVHDSLGYYDRDSTEPQEVIATFAHDQFLLDELEKVHEALQKMYQHLGQKMV